jgi:pyruvate,water dikinase
MFRFLDFFWGSRDARALSPEESALQRRYASFKRLLLANNRALEIIADLENTVYQDKPFTYLYAVSQTESLLVEVESIAAELDSLSGRRFPDLPEVTRGIAEKIFAELSAKRRFEDTRLVMPIERLSLDNAAEVGGKAANLGEIANRAHLPVPPGFAVTAFGYQLFMDYSELTEAIAERLRGLDINDTDALMAASADIQQRILAAELPADLQGAILQAAGDLRAKLPAGFKLAVRSSATSEDSEASFAGQHSTVLNVGEENLIAAYREVVASTFNPRAIYYRRRRGYRDQDVNMSVACIAMVDARVSGVMYTADPNDSRNAVILISAVWGLAADAVEGAVDSDFFEVDKHTRRLRSSRLAFKRSRLRPDAGDGVRAEELPEALRTAPSLDGAEIERLAEAGLTLERHYGFALDIEWAIGGGGRLFILQARPLRRVQPFGAEPAAARPPAEAIAAAVILRGGQTACDGAASGHAFVIASDHVLHHIPEGSVVVARQTSPRYVPLMGRIQAFVTDVGSVTGHMASVAREFRIPTLVGLGQATAVIPHGEEVTVDATGRTVYRGRVAALLAEITPVNPIRDSPTYNRMKAALKRIAPLTLTDPAREDFTPAGCRTLHDVIRFAHEMAMQAMFRIGEGMAPDERAAVPLRAYLPMKILVVDLGNGLRAGRGGGPAEVDDVASLPFRALLRGMMHKGVDWSRDVGVNWGGLASIVAQSMIRDPMVEGRMGAPSYAIVAGRYLNFSSRLGYHFTTVDAFCGESVNDNYITFYFKGGAADIGRRSRRARLIAVVLKRMDFKIVQKGDMVRAELKKFEAAVIEEKLDLIGRLLGSVRLLDMHLADDRQVEWYAEQFLKGNYRFEAEATDGA